MTLFSSQPEPPDLVPAAGNNSDPPGPLMVQEIYFQLADFYLKNPEASLAEASKHFNKTQRWVATIKNSDAFQEYFQAKHKEIVTGIKRKTETLVEIAIDRLIHRVENDELVDLLKTSDLQEIIDKGSKRLGYGSAAPAGVSVTVGVAVGRDVLADARQKMQEAYGVTPEAPASMAKLQAARESIPPATRASAEPSFAEIAVAKGDKASSPRNAAVDAEIVD